MKKTFKTLAKSTIRFFCFLSLLSLYFFCFIGYMIPVEKMCRVYVFQIKWLVLLFSILLMIIFPIDDMIWNYIKTSEDKKIYKPTKLHGALLILPMSIILTETAIYAFSQLARLAISLEMYLIFSGICVLFLSLVMIIRRNILCGKLNQKLTQHQRTLIGIIAAIVMIVSAVMIVPQAADRIKTYNMYWEGSPKTPYTFEYKVEDGYELTVENIDGLNSDAYIPHFDLMPKNVLKEFIKDGWSICIDSNYLAEYSWQSNGKRYGPLFYAISDDPSKTIITHSYYPAIKEIGRYLYNNTADKELLHSIFKKELNGMNIISQETNSCSINNEADFFATCFMKYAATQGDEEKKAELYKAVPLMCEYFESNIFCNHQQ